LSSWINKGDYYYYYYYYTCRHAEATPRVLFHVSNVMNRIRVAVTGKQ